MTAEIYLFIISMKKKNFFYPKYLLTNLQIKIIS